MKRRSPRDMFAESLREGWSHFVCQIAVFLFGMLFGIIVIGGSIVEHWGLVHIDGNDFGQRYIEHEGVRYNLVEVEGSGTENEAASIK